jgi:hypothetical protein
MDIEQVRTLVTQKCGQPPQPQDDAALNELVDEAAHPDVREYLRYCLPPETYLASQIRVLPWEAIVREMGEGSAPGSFIRPFGYLIVATSVGGNVLCLHQTTGRVFWADHDSFSDDMIMFQNQATGSWEYLYEYTPANVERAMVPVSENFETFLNTLLADQLTAQLDALD